MLGCIPFHRCLLAPRRDDGAGWEWCGIVTVEQERVAGKAQFRTAHKAYPSGCILLLVFHRDSRRSTHFSLANE